MLTYQELPGTNIVELAIDGSVTAEEFDSILARLKSAIERHGKIRVLEVVHSLDTPPIPWSKFWEDIKFGFEHLSDISHAAVVADQAWITTIVKLFNPLCKAELKCFKIAEIDDARAWLREQQPDVTPA